ncbi:MAG: PAS domain S-box protein, partial [Pseudomonadales bacterium]
ELRASEARFREMADAAPAMLWVTDAALACIFLSRGWYEHTGRHPGNALGERWAEPVHVADRDRLKEAFTSAAQRQEPFQIEYRLRVADGSYRWTLDMGRPQLDPSGGLLGYIGSVVDIEDRRLAERETERNAALLDAVLESLPVGVIIADPEGRLVRWNRAHEQLWGLDAGASGEAEGIADYDRWVGWWPDTGAHIQAHEWTLAQALLTKEPVPARLMEIERFDGGGRRFLMNASAPVVDANGQLIAAVAAQTDVTEQRQTQEALRDADRRKDEFLATLAHELRNPLAPIRMAVELLKLKGPEDATVISARDVIDRQLADLTRLVDDLLEVSRITRGALELRKDLVELRPVIERGVEAARPLIDASHHRLEVTLAAGEHWLLADATRLAQVFTNLLNNAARY